MADTSQAETNPLLRRPLYIYDLPPELLFTLTVAGKEHSQPPDHTPPDEPTVRRTNNNEDGVTNSTSCSLCKVIFNSVQDQRNHVKSDFHRYNLKLSIKQQPLVDEATFVRLIGDLDESLSGSDSDDSEDENDDGLKAGDSTLTALLRKQAKISHQEADGETEGSGKRGYGNAPLIWLSSPKLGDDVRLGVYRAILSSEEQEQAPTSLVDIIQKKQLKPVPAKLSGQAQKDAIQAAQSDPHFFLCMIGGGHFAAMVVSLVPELRKGPGGVEERHAVVKAHKTFHRYTTRRKQGGSQSANDNAKGNAHSAGSSIRRYNEMALEADVRAVLHDWRATIDTAELLLIRATGSTNRRTLFGPYDGQVLRSTDKRIRGFPFSTRRATQAELLRSFQELTRLKVSKLVEPAPEKLAPEKAPKERKAKPQAPKLSKEEEALQFHTSQLQALIRRSKAPGVLLYLTKNELSPDFTFFPAAEHRHAPTPLHLSASTNSPALILALLTKARANPTIRNDDGKTAYDIAGDAKTRDAFRIARHQLGENAFDWAAAHIPAALSQEEVDAKAAQEKAISDAAEAQRRKADLERLRQEEEKRSVTRIERKAGAGKTLAAAVEKTGAEKREEEARGLTPEMRMKLERERRARAAEERLKRMQGGR
ncbi:finger and ankyrin domain protein [Cladophialophora carrionii]|uniref:Finger and ankyrin domain protein n=1 Tax=Cladophialophora carrionii TaxID=86049 RepID=A0A1C1CPZ4_9EURO|nr:finger and ankyrin domain protein [Cladophialophora carrionii]